MKDLLNAIAVRRAISPVSVADNTAQVSQIIDRQGYDGLTFLIATGSLADADATFAVTMAESDDSGMSGSNTVAAADIIGSTTLASFQFDSDDSTRKIGYKGSKRYVTLTITPSNNSSAGLMSAVAVLSGAALKPTSNP
jgi:hypothetical protein